MGRGLSELQRWIVRRAGSQRRLYYAEILEGFFGWKPRRPFRRHGAGFNPLGGPLPEGDLVDPGSCHFSRQRIGEERYRKAMATLSRSCARLAARGLVDWLQASRSHWAGVEITDKGREWLSVNSVLPGNMVNR